MRSAELMVWALKVLRAEALLPFCSSRLALAARSRSSADDLPPLPALPFFFASLLLLLLVVVVVVGSFIDPSSLLLSSIF